MGLAAAEVDSSLTPMARKLHITTSSKALMAVLSEATSVITALSCEEMAYTFTASQWTCFCGNPALSRALANEAFSIPTEVEDSAQTFVALR